MNTPTIKVPSASSHGKPRVTEQQIIDASAIPEASKTIVRAIVGQTRLRRSERAELARELCSHFEEGIAAGAEPNVLAMEFGDPKRAAKLIRRAVVRKRGWADQVVRRFKQGMAVAGVLALGWYGVMFVRYNFGEPVLSRNYTAEYNAEVARVPESDRAWPMYADLLRRWTPYAPEIREKNYFESKPGEEGYEAMMANIKPNLPLLPVLREAAARPSLGLPMSMAVDPAVLDYQRRAGTLDANLPSMQTDSENPALIAIPLPHLGLMRVFARTLAFDAAEAIRAGDGPRVEANVRAMLGIGSQTGGTGILINDLVSIAIVALGYDTISDCLYGHPELLDDAALKRIAHAASSIPPSISAGMGLEREMFMDVVQRVYSDNGRGDGVIVNRGLRDFGALMGDGVSDSNLMMQSNALPIFGRNLLGPVAAGFYAGRKDLTSMYDRMVTNVERVGALPMWEWPEDFEGDAEYERLPTIEKQRYLLLGMMMPALGKAIQAPQAAMQQRDGVLTAIALELHKRRHGKYPATLAELTPDLLPAVLPDRIDGRPIRYKIVDGRPLLYSVGVDRIDDGGVPLHGDRALQRNFRWMSPRLAAERRASELQRSKGVVGTADAPPDAIAGDAIIYPIR
jgi:hypothetical protein